MILSCCLIGEDSLLIQCGNILLNHNHIIPLIVSTNPSSIDWAKEHNIPCADQVKSIAQFDLNQFDYIFSIANSHILSSEIVNLAKYQVINYHDSLLPNYAGLNSSTWAIINSEKEHGISWHIVLSKIDAGDIVKQKKIPILPEDTAFALNLRCYEEAISAFAELITDIESNNVTVIKQNLQNRSYFGLGHSLPNFGFIDWETFSAEFIVRIHRALCFDHYSNNVGVLKIYTPNHILIPIDLEVFPKDSSAVKPGTVMALNQETVLIATTSQMLKIKQLSSNQGQNIEFEDLFRQYGIQLGDCLPSPPNSIIPAENNLHLEIMKLERYWIERIKAFSEHSIFYPIQNTQTKQPLQKLSLSVAPNKIADLESEQIKTIVLTAILIYLFRVNNYETFSVLLVNTQHQKINQQFGNLFSIFMPLTPEWPTTLSMAEALSQTSADLTTLEKNQTFYADTCIRYPGLKNIFSEAGIYINLNEPFSQEQLPDHAAIYFEYDKTSNFIQIYHKFDVENNFCEHKDLLANLPSHLSNILTCLLENRSIHLDSFCFLNEVEKTQLIDNWGKGPHRIIDNSSISDLFETQVQRNPDASALLVNDNSISYSELWRQAEYVAQFIQSKHIAPQSLIGIYIERSQEMFAIILGILKADCVYVPLDPIYPLVKIAKISDIANLAWIITKNNYLADLKQCLSNKSNLEIYSIETIQQLNPRSVTSTTQIKTRPDPLLAYVMFTSGTTGDPKGVMTTQSNVINYCNWFCETTDFDEHSIIDFSSSFAFDLSIPCSLVPLLVGGTVAICNEKTKTDPRLYLQHLYNNQVSHVELTPGYLEMLLHYPDLITPLTSLKMVLLGADTLPISDVVTWSKLCPSHQIVNEYGPTEATVSVTSHFVGAQIGSYHSSVPIGKPGVNTHCYILDKFGNLCPSGMKGELHIGGAQVALGYLGNPELTQEKFIYSNLPNIPEKLYKTGDCVSWLPDGNLQFFGRNDFQVKIQGYRVELAGVEAVLLKIPAIKQAVVVAKSGHFKDKYLCAYLVGDKKFLNYETINSFLLSQIPAYMIPKEFYLTHCIPLKQNEKIDYPALAAQSHEILTHHYSEDLDLDGDENLMINIWKSAFNDSNIELFDNFFELGGNSLIALKIVSDVKKSYKIEMPLAHLFEFPTVSKLSQKIKQLNNDNQDNSNDYLKSIIKLSDHNEGIPLYLVHPIGGSAFWYKQLTLSMNQTYTVFGIQDISIDGHDLRFNSIEEMASYYIKQINHFHNDDSYCLGGASFGATVAFEMAHQLIQAGKHIKFLGLIDGWTEYPASIMNTHTAALLQYKDEVSSDADKQKVNYLKELEDYRRELLKKYVLKPLASSAILFKAEELWDEFLPVDNYDNGWSPYILGKLETHKIPGNHVTIFYEPNVQKLSSILDQLA